MTINSIFEKLEDHFFSLPHEEYCDQELIRLLSLNDKEVELEFQEHPERFQKYLKATEEPNRILLVEEPKTESDTDSEKPIRVNTRVERSDLHMPKDVPESSSAAKKRKNLNSQCLYIMEFQLVQIKQVIKELSMF